MWKGLLIAALVLVLLGVVAVGYIVPNIRIHEQRAGDGVRVETPFGSVGVQAQKGGALDLKNVPIYPGAERTKKEQNAGAVIDFEWGGKEKQLSVAGAEFVTDDSPATVREWYRARLPEWHTNEKDEMIYSDAGRKRVIAVKSKDGKTHIGIASFGEPLAN